jgi:hypothetical protein
MLLLPNRCLLNLPAVHSGFVADLEAWKKMVILCSPLLAEED